LGTTVGKKADDLLTKYLEAERKLEEEERIRAELEESLNPRLMYFLKFSDGTTNIDDLKSLKEKSVRLRYVPDAEAARAAVNLAGLFRLAGCNIEPILPLAELTPETLGQDGITVELYVPPKRELSGTSPDLSIALANHKAHVQSVATTDAVIKWLRENSWEAQPGYAEPGEMPPDSILVRVGLKPYQFFEDAQYKKVIDEDNKRRHIDPNRYKNKSVVWKSLNFGIFTKFAGPTSQIRPDEK
jgi:hypothetical protein